MDITARTLTSLEWESFLRHYSDLCRSSPAKKQALLIDIPNSQPESETLLQYTAEGLNLLQDAQFATLDLLEESTVCLERLAIGSVLSGKELLLLGNILRISQDVQNAVAKVDPTPIPLLVALVQKLLLHPELQKSISRVIDNNGDVKDDASPKLQRLRSEERSLRNQARDRAQEALQAAVKNGYAQDSFLDIRNNRFLIPIKSEHRSKIPGLILEASSSRASVFVEPTAVREIQERISQIISDSEEEIYRILQETTAAAEPFSTELKQSYFALLDFDLILGRARMALFYSDCRGASRPSFGQDFLLEGLYHPLLAHTIPAEKIVRNTLRITPTQKVMIISGPNTGGKTVFLKAAGLASLMAKTGFYVCASGDAILPYSRFVLAQIGDEQSLEKSLSSFSASIASLKEIIEKAGAQSLVLIDEILHSTDPEEAAALAKAIFEHFAEFQSYAIVTTHLSGLRTHGDSRYVSASMEFDAGSITPTYRLRMGTPGTSRALEIASRLGLPNNIISAAKKYLDSNQLKLSEILARLEQKELSLTQAQEEANIHSAEIARERELIAEERMRLHEQKRNFQAQARARLRELEREAVLKADSLLEELKNKFNQTTDKHQAAHETKEKILEMRSAFRPTELETTEKDTTGSLSRVSANISKPFSQDPWRNGAKVFVETLQSDGVLLCDRKDSPKRADVAVGTMKIKVEWERLTLKEAPPPVDAPRAKGNYLEPAECAPELYLLGKRVDEALQKLADFMDRASRSGRPSVRIVHGFGTGALRDSVRLFLKKSGYAMHYRPGQPNEGGDGCTIVEFK